jgi:imidazolonepropionase-like amidohydrolase
MALPKDNGVTVLKGGRLIDGGGGAPIDNSVVIIKGDMIEAAGRGDAVSIPPGADVLDISGMTVMPGLIDAHCHIHGIKSMHLLTCVLEAPELRGMRAVMDTWRLVDSGFTTVRDCGNPNGPYLKKAIEEGSIIGPRILSCRAVITQTAGHGDVAHSLPMEWAKQRGICRIADGVDECRKAAREQLREGADFIKLCSTGGVMSEKDSPTSSQFTVEEISAMVEEAHNVGVKAASHAQGTRGIKNALLAGIDTIEHGVYLDDEAIEMMIKQETYLVPTLAIFEAIVTRGPQSGVPEVHVEKARVVRETHLKSFERAWQAGISIGLGTDYLSDPMSPMGGNAIELELYVKGGRSPMEAIVSATRTNSELLGLGDTLGTLEPGKLADLIVVKGDPLRDITILRDRANILSVYKDGVSVPRLSTWTGTGM